MVRHGAAWCGMESEAFRVLMRAGVMYLQSVMYVI